MTRNLTKRPVKRDPLQLALRLSITFALGGLLFILIGVVDAGSCLLRCRIGLCSGR
jgi:hypothetical protein